MAVATMQPDQPETYQRIRGHALRNEGRAFHAGDRVFRGRAVCECGTQSEPLESDAARKRWHRQHKAGVLAQRAGP